MSTGGANDHTADLILEFKGDNLEGLFTDAATGMLGTITYLEGIGEKVEERIKLEAPNLGELLVCWLNELLFLLDARRLIFVRYDFEVINNRELVARAFGDEVDLSVRAVGAEIKAVTYHGIYLEKDKAGWCARVLFDL